MCLPAINSNYGVWFFTLSQEKFSQEFITDGYQAKFTKLLLEKDYEMLQQVFYCNLLIHSIENVCWGIFIIKFS